MRRPASLALLSIAACSSSPTGTIQLVTGAETDTFTRSPAPTALIVDAVDSQGTPTTLARVPLPATNVDLGKRDENAVAAITVSAVDALGDPVVFGSSLPLQYGSLEGATIPIFVQRTGELARMPGPLSDPRQAPVLSQVQGRYLFVGAGNDTAIAETTQLYDFLTFAPLPAPPTLPRVPQSIAFVGTVALLIDASGGTYDERLGRRARPYREFLVRGRGGWGDRHRQRRKRVHRRSDSSDRRSDRGDLGRGPREHEERAIRNRQSHVGVALCTTSGRRGDVGNWTWTRRYRGRRHRDRRRDSLAASE